jgi:hypothetical protein
MSMTNASWLKTSRFLSRRGCIRFGNMVDPKYTMGVSVLKKYLFS